MMPSNTSDLLKSKPLWYDSLMDTSNTYFLIVLDLLLSVWWANIYKIELERIIAKKDSISFYGGNESITVINYYNFLLFQLHKLPWHNKQYSKIKNIY
jgi:hypothetical protein